MVGNQRRRRRKSGAAWIGTRPVAARIAPRADIRSTAMIARHKVVSHQEWLEARAALLASEKAFTHEREALSQARRDLPWEEVTADYCFEGPAGMESLADLFAGRSQLIVYHFMFAPDWDVGCAHCSFWADNFDPIIVHLNQRDVTMVAVSRAAHAKLSAYQRRMGWKFRWLSSGASSFNFDYQVSFHPAELATRRVRYNYTVQDAGPSEREGVSVFCRDETGRIFHTYSSYARGIDMLNYAGPGVAPASGAG
jgi:predicted dithiol-disulfide oxidoreductase (DUF899 family)